MGGSKKNFQIELNPDQMDFVRMAMEKYDIIDEGKVVRIIMDYMIATPQVRDQVLGKVRCLRCN